MKKQGWILIGITGAFLCLLLGVFIGRNARRSYLQIDASQSPTTQVSQTQTTPSKPAESLGMLNINTATAEQLQLLPDIGEVLAQRIIDYRNQNGIFSNIDELKNVSGIGDARFDKIKNYITIG